MAHVALKDGTRISATARGRVFRDDEGLWNLELPSEVLRETGGEGFEIWLGVRPENLRPRRGDERSEGDVKPWLNSWNHSVTIRT